MAILLGVSAFIVPYRMFELCLNVKDTLHSLKGPTVCECVFVCARVHACSAAEWVTLKHLSPFSGLNVD